MTTQESSHGDAAAQATPSPHNPESLEQPDDGHSAAQAANQRCQELQAQIASLSVAAALRADIINEQSARIEELECHLRSQENLVAELQSRLGQDPALQAPPAAISLRRRVYWRLRRQAGQAVRRIVR